MYNGFRFILIYNYPSFYLFCETPNDCTWFSGSTHFSFQEIIKDDDEKLKGLLRKEVGERAYNAVVKALMKMNECNPSGRYVTSELWNYKKGRKATLQEGVQSLLKRLKRKRRI